MIYNTDWLENDIPDKSINLIIADPPYFEVKGEFDFVWPDFESYLQDVSKWAIECKRVLADNGCLLWWGHAKKIAYSQVIFDKYFNLENSLIWWVFDRQTNKGYETYRSFMPVTEHCLFYSNDDPVNLTKCIYDIRDYIRSEILKSKGEIILKDINIALETAFNGGGVASAVLSLEKTEPVMITEEMYIKLQDYCRPYLRKPYEELRTEYEELRRPYNNTYKLTDIIRHSQEANISRDYDHDTIKPLQLTKKLIQTTTRKGDLVLIPFGGSGTDVEACISTGREYICYEIAEKHYNTIKARENNALLQMELFT